MFPQLDILFNLVELQRRKPIFSERFVVRFCAFYFILSRLAAPQVGKEGQKNGRGAAVRVWPTTQFEESRLAAPQLEILSKFLPNIRRPPPSGIPHFSILPQLDILFNLIELRRRQSMFLGMFCCAFLRFLFHFPPTCGAVSRAKCDWRQIRRKNLPSWVVTLWRAAARS